MDFLNKDFLIELTIRLYKITLLFPKKEPLRIKIREIADEILADSILISQNPSSNLKDLKRKTESNLEILNSYFEIAKVQNWLKPELLLELQKDYQQLKENFEKSLDTLPSEFLREKLKIFREKELPSEKKFFDLQPRLKKILTFFEKNHQLQVKDLKENFSNVSKRTLRRDLKILLEKGFIIRKGEKNKTFYQLTSIRTT